MRCDIRILMDGGDYRWVELIGTIDKHPEREHEQLAGIAIDISNRKDAEEQLKIEAITDPLTGVLNRRKMEQVVQEQLDSSIETGDAFSFLMIDIDYFKKVNDRYGHPTGDKILIHFVGICRECLRKNDYFARVGGEEFALLLPETDESAAKLIGNRIRETVERTPFVKGKEKIYYTISIGCASQKDDSIEKSRIYALADSALYRAKNAGRNRIFSIEDYNFKD